MAKNKLNDVGAFSKRCEFNPTEKAFADEWRKENDRKYSRGINFGYGILQDMFIDGSLFRNYAKTVINKRDRYIVATVMQWLGSNIGRCFLQTVLKKEGYIIVKINKEDNND